ncbi:efflux RND transporter periplasmic adaptor subunit [Telluria mixta]|uniref:Efflux RND transporter periplasmic adaptor subunit n=1 Tax=Telluria mixta TaxID=34071 RepID=A0ABT2BUH5_9BURK|nr:efflux RND transporter periplasmic adaptor subunit [Telluria mixta]MCS0628084.1 efflux RND transporter periplasmic adaptor subunit [Telluria mixta]WEM93800.1 efflux RND transporter periplasmic adaptor subunit [Telluria mixta]
MSIRSRSARVLCLLPIALAACGDKPAADARTAAPLVETVLVQDAPAAARSFTGTVGARVQSDLGFRVPGKVVQRLVDVGQTVHRGQPLMRIDPIDLGLQARAQAEAVTAARARARQAADDEARYRDLVAEGAVSASAYEQLKAAADSARAQLSAAEAQYDVARNAAGYAVLVADADGVVVDTLAEPGQVVGAGQPVVRLAHAGPREAVVQLPETMRPRLGSQAQATLYGGQAAGVARLRQLADAADRLTRTYEAKYVLDGPLADAPLGATVTLRLDGEGRADALKTGALQVPAAAVLDAGKGSGVWTVAGDPARVMWRKVDVLAIGDDMARVTGQLKPGERVVALGAHLLHEGDTVRVDRAARQVAAATAQGAAR